MKSNTCAAHWSYLKYVLRHKWYVFLAGRKTKAPLWRLLVHDWTKFLPSEWTPYVNYFNGICDECGEKLSSEDCGFEPYVKRDFNLAWLRHQRRNKHHWQYWVLVNDNPGREKAVEIGSGTCVRSLSYRTAIEMPEKYVREMVADWAGAGRAITGKWEVKAWYEKNEENILLHPSTRLLVKELLSYFD